MPSPQIDLSRVTQKVMCQILGVSEVTVIKLREAGILPSLGAAKYDVAATVKAYIAYIQRGRIAIERSENRTQMDDEKLRRLRLDNDKESGVSVSRADAVTAFNEALSIIAGGLDAMPGRLSAELAGMSDAARIRQKLKDEVHAIRTQAADRLAVLGDREASEPALTPSGEPRARRVGRPKSRDAARKPGAGKVQKQPNTLHAAPAARGVKG